MICSAVAVLFDPSAGVALQAFQPFPRVRGIELRRFDGSEVFTTGLSFLRSKHVLREFASSPRHRQIHNGCRGLATMAVAAGAMHSRIAVIAVNTDGIPTLRFRREPPPAEDGLQFQPVVLKNETGG